MGNDERTFVQNKIMKPKYYYITLLIGTGLFSGLFQANAEDPEFWSWAQTPPMGWNSWDGFATTVTEAQTRAQADFMAQHTAPARLAIHRRGHPMV